MAKPMLGLPPKAVATEASQKAPPPYLGASVVVLTSIKMAGQNEHAAIVTRVHSDDVVSVMMFPADGQAYPIASINRDGSPSWHWPRK